MWGLMMFRWMSRQFVEFSVMIAMISSRYLFHNTLLVDFIVPLEDCWLYANFKKSQKKMFLLSEVSWASKFVFSVNSLSTHSVARLVGIDVKMAFTSKDTKTWLTGIWMFSSCCLMSRVFFSFISLNSVRGVNIYLSNFLINLCLLYICNIEEFCSLCPYWILGALYDETRIL